MRHGSRPPASLLLAQCGLAAARRPLCAEEAVWSAVWEVRSRSSSRARFCSAQPRMYLEHKSARRHLTSSYVISRQTSPSDITGTVCGYSGSFGTLELTLSECHQ